MTRFRSELPGRIGAGLKRGPRNFSFGVCLRDDLPVIPFQNRYGGTVAGQATDIRRVSKSPLTAPARTFQADLCREASRLTLRD